MLLHLSTSCQHFTITLFQLPGAQCFPGGENWKKNDERSPLWTDFHKVQNLLSQKLKNPENQWNFGLTWFDKSFPSGKQFLGHTYRTLKQLQQLTFPSCSNLFQANSVTHFYNFSNLFQASSGQLSQLTFPNFSQRESKLGDKRWPGPTEEEASCSTTTCDGGFRSRVTISI